MTEHAANDFAADYGFSQSKRAGGLIFISGQVGADHEFNVPSDPATQFKLAFDALGAVLTAEGRTAGDLIELSSFHTDFPNHMEQFMQAKAEFLGGARPAWTAVGVAALGTPETLVEIKAIAAA